MTAQDRARVLAAMTIRPGKANGIKGWELAQMLELHQREVRQAITDLRLEGIAICGKPDTGYFIAATPEELEETCNFLRSRAMHSLTLESKLRHVPLPELLGQLRLKT